MARTLAPDYLKTLAAQKEREAILSNNGQGTGPVGQQATYTNGENGVKLAGGSQTPYSSADTNAAYNAAIAHKYSQGTDLTNQYTYSPTENAAYAKQVQERYQGGPAVSSAQLGQAAYDQAQGQRLAAVGAQRGSGGQAQGLRAAMMGTTGAASAQTQAGMQSTQEQVAQRQQILQQGLQSEAQRQQATRDWQAEKDRFAKEKAEADADTQSGMVKMAGTYSGLGMMSDSRTKDVKKRKLTRAPQLVIMLGGGK